MPEASARLFGILLQLGQSQGSLENYNLTSKKIGPGKLHSKLKINQFAKHNIHFQLYSTCVGSEGGSKFKWLAPGTCGSDLKCVISKHMLGGSS